MNTSIVCRDDTAPHIDRLLIHRQLLDLSHHSDPYARAQALFSRGVSKSQDAISCRISVRPEGLQPVTGMGCGASAMLAFDIACDQINQALHDSRSHEQVSEFRANYEAVI